MQDQDNSVAHKEDFGFRHCIFVGGCSRSGTTLFGSILGAAEGAIVTPESQFKSDVHKSIARGDLPATSVAIRNAIESHWRFKLWGTEFPGWPKPGNSTAAAIVLEAVHGYAVARGICGVSWWIDHSPDNIRDARWLLTEFPDAKILHLVRDGRAVAASLLRMDVGPNSVLAAAKLWVQSVGVGLAVEAAFPKQVSQVRFESLVENPAETIRQTCTFTGLPYSDRMLGGGDFQIPSYSKNEHALVGEPPKKSAAHRWRRTLTSREIELFELVAGPMLEALGYELLFHGCPRPARLGERFNTLYRDLIWGRVRSRFLNWRRRRQTRS